jgi:hypothetical protein
MKERTKVIVLSESEASRLVWGLQHLSRWVRESNAPHCRKHKTLKENDSLISRLRSAFIVE